MLFNTLELSEIHYLAVIVAALVYFFLGAIWFSRIMFADAWMAAQNITPGEIDKSNLAKLMLISLIMNLLTCFAIAVLIQLISIGSPVAGIKLGILIGVFFVFATQLINSLYENRPFKLVMINAGYHVTGIVLASWILTIWQ